MSLSNDSRYLQSEPLKYLTNTSEAKCKQTRLGEPLLPKAFRLVPVQTASNIIVKFVWLVLEMYGRVTKIIWSVLEMHGRVLESYG